MNKYGKDNGYCPCTDAFKRFWQRYFDFKGRSSRSEYWWAVVWIYIVAILAGVVLGKAATDIAFLIMLIPHLAIMIRRIHDCDRSAWYILLGIVPIIGGLALIAMFCCPPVNDQQR